MTYSDTLALDQILRNADIPSKYYPAVGELEFPTPGRRLKEWTLTCFRPLCKNSTLVVTLVLNESNPQVFCSFTDHSLFRLFWSTL